MSLLIKGMEMPENCDDCFLGDFYCPQSQHIDGYKMIYRPYDCPLVPVPAPHGRLIDADALKEVIAATYYSQDEKDKAPMDDIPWMNGSNTKVKEVCWMIDDAPAAIEAEE